MNICTYEPNSEYQAKTYYDYEKQSGSRHNRKCINGKITGCGKCVAYCEYVGHPGFLTGELRFERNCIDKGCNYYVEKPKRTSKAIPQKTNDTEIINAANDYIGKFEGMKFIKAAMRGGEYILQYITISDCYPVKQIENEIADLLGMRIRLNRLNYNFDICAALILAD